VRRNEFLTAWNAYFARFRQQELAGHPRVRSIRAVSVRSDHKAGARHWRKYRAAYSTMTEAQLKVKLKLEHRPFPPSENGGTL
jgi:hypothetical protein